MTTERMTTKEALDWLEARKEHYELDDNCQPLVEALNMAIQSLEQEPCDNAISRQAVINAMRKNHRSGGRDIDGDYIEGDYRECLYDDIISLPPVTPQESKMGHWIRELIRNEKGGCIDAKMICSECGNDNKHDEYMNYCPNCGAKMSEIPTGSTTKNDLAHNLCNSCTNIGCEFQSGIIRTECAFYMPPHIEPDNCGNYVVQDSTAKNDLGVDWDELKRKILMEVDGGTDDKWLSYADVCDNISNSIDDFKADLPSATPQQPRWIFVSERLPERSGEYLVSVIDGSGEDNDYEAVRVAWFAHKKVYNIKESEWRELGIDETVIAWMPLPESCKVESEG